MSAENREYLNTIYDLERHTFRVRKLLERYLQHPNIRGALFQKIHASIKSLEEAQTALNTAYCAIGSTNLIARQNADAARSTL